MAHIVTSHVVLLMSTNSPQLGSSEPKHDSQWQSKNHPDQSKQSCPPSIAQARIQLRCKQRKSEPKQIAEHSRRRIGRCRRFLELIEQISQHSLSSNETSNGENDGADVNHDPVDTALSRPASPEESDGTYHCSDGEQGHAVFWRCFFVWTTGFHFLENYV